MIVSQLTEIWLSMIAGNLHRNMGDRNWENLRPLLWWTLMCQLASRSCSSSGISGSSAMMMLKQKSHWLVCRVKLDAKENHEANKGMTYFTAPTQIRCLRENQESRRENLVEGGSRTGRHPGHRHRGRLGHTSRAPDAKLQSNRAFTLRAAPRNSGWLKGNTLDRAWVSN